MSNSVQHVSGSRSSVAAAAVRVVDVSRTYRRERGGDLQAVDRVSMNVPNAEFCSILGPSGCGKSTMLMMIAGLYPPTSGQIFIGNVPVEAPFSDLGMVFQKDVLLDWRTVLDNVLLPIEIKRRTRSGAPPVPYRARALELLSLVGLQDFANAYPEELSGGMRQRAAICRALIHDPPLLLMDEPFGALDALTRERLNLDLMRLTAESAKTVVFVTHSIEEAVLLSDQIVVLTPRPGRVLRTVRVDLPRPRTLATRAEPAFHRLVDDIRNLFHSTGVI